MISGGRRAGNPSTVTRVTGVTQVVGAREAASRRLRLWQGCPVNDAPQTPDLAVLVDEWLDWHQAAKALGASVNRIRTMIREHELAAAVPVEGGGQKVPAAFFQNGEVVKGLSGLVTLFHDARWEDREIIAWLFTDDDLPGRPIDALRENRGSEAKRRAAALAF